MYEQFAMPVHSGTKISPDINKSHIPQYVIPACYWEHTVQKSPLLQYNFNAELSTHPPDNNLLVRQLNTLFPLIWSMHI